MILWIGIDDTDNLDSRGTGFIARSLAEHLTVLGLGKCEGISRHQLFVDPAIPYTSHNSSLCLKWQTETGNTVRIIHESAQFLLTNAASGSDPGLCVVSELQFDPILEVFGQDAKTKVLQKQTAIDLAQALQLHLSEHGGTGGGVIGALAGVGLGAGGKDGRFVWLRGIRELKGVFTAKEILEKTGVKKIQALNGAMVSDEELIETGEWFRPVLLDHQPVLLVEASDNALSGWKIIDRETIKAYY